MAIQHAAFTGIAREQRKLLAVTAPVHRLQRTARMYGLFLRQNVSIVIEEGNNPRALPEINQHVLQSRQIRAIFGDAGILRVAHAHVLQNLAALVEDQQSLVAAGGIGARLGFGIAAEISQKNRVGMIVELFIVAPKLAAGVVPERVAQHEFIAAVAVNIGRVREVSGLALAVPQQFEIIIEDPKIPITVFYQNFLTVFRAGKI